ncbi:acyl-CoA N-acyltransferase [Zopfia rhizophila CBS 207.26]|uniref:Acyl-CoA N-acyltransferase n=1 Tax=Zopfia rhizophila CBS 207.26 TaxID=1314779 RepID=A0A6A6DJS8_9PEZI|nr:acyl-CoA N-acyltransferase [Zopfia rhizophila CBS 207.26]
MYITLRFAKQEDIPSISRIGSTVFRQTFGHSIPSLDLKDYLEASLSHSAISTELLNPNLTYIVAINSSGFVAGFLQLNRASSEPCLVDFENFIEIQRAYVDEKYHSKGIGKLLFDEAERFAREQGYRHVWLGVWEENLRAQKFYDKRGYRRVGEHDFVMGVTVQVDWIMVKEL